MADMNQAFEALRRAHAAGDTESARRLSEWIQSQQPAAPEPTLRQKFISSAPMRVVQGMRDPIDAGAQLLPRAAQFVTSAGGLAPNRVSEFFGSEAQRVDSGISEAEREYEASRMATGQEGMDWARLAGNVASPVNAAIATKLPMLTTTTGRVFGGAAVGGLGGALQPVNTERTPDFSSAKAGQVILGAGTGAIATPIMGRIGDFLGRKLASAAAARNPAQQFITLRQTTEEFAKASGMDWDSMAPAQQDELFQVVKKAAQEYAGKDPRVAIRIADFKQLDMPYTLGQVTRDPLQFATEKNLQQLPGMGDPLRERFVAQGAALQRQLAGTAAGAGESQQTGQTLIKALRQVDDDFRAGIDESYKFARQLSGKDAEVPLQGLAQDLHELIRTAPLNVKNSLPLGAFDEFGLLGAKQTKLFTVEEANKLLETINANSSNDPAVIRALGVLRRSVKKAMSEDAGVEDVFAPARRLAAQRFSLQEAVPALEAAASGQANPDTFVQNFLISKTASTPQVKELARVLREQQPEAFAEAKAQIGAYLQRQAFGENLTGDKGVSPERFAKALRELGSEKLSAFFTPRELSNLQRVSRVASYMESVPYGARPNTSGNWGAITQMAGAIPGVPMTAAIAGALRNSVSNQLAVNQALAAQPVRQLTPEQIRMVSQYLTAGTLASGGASAQPLK